MNSPCPELFDRLALKVDAAGGERELRALHGGQECIGKCLNAQPESPCECSCSGICHSSGRCILRR